MLVSVVIPVYNRAWCVARAVRSVLGQTHEKLECIVVDDGSTDGTGGVLAGIGDERLVLLRQENAGVSAARNAGLAAGRGARLALLDSDDEWLPEKLEKQLAYMDATAHAVCQTEEVWIRNGRRVNPKSKHAKPSGAFFERALKLCLVSPSCVMFTREYWDEMGPFDESLPACEDYDLWLRTLLHHEIGLLPEALTVKYGGHADQLSTTVPALDRLRVRAMVKLLNRSDLSEAQRAATKAELLRKARVFVLGCRKRGKEAEAQEVRDVVLKETGRDLFG